ncbi:MAG: SMP-30/gluconolactonase/LRE family protein [Proteobacteria bacterium]|nr:SMP-30/gluconolactonase/LRE family protein [Pseudomonadota bacterium]
MRIRTWRESFLVSLLFLVGMLINQISAAEAADACASEQGMVFVCGPQNAEDLIRVEGTPWIIASGMSGEGISGHMYLLDPAQRSYQELYPGASPAFRWNTDEFATCPGQLNVADFSAHGLAIRALGGGMHRLYVTSHGERESVEVFEVDARGETPALTWVGCVVMPEHASINSVAPLPDGGFVTTRISGEGPEAFGNIFTGDITGYLYEWHPGGAIAVVAGTEMSGPNGIEVSPDGSKVFVASWGRGEVSRFGRAADGGLSHEQTVKTNFRVDNLRWSRQGTLFAVGHRMSANQDCGQPLCMDEWEVAEVNPDTMTTRTLAVKKPVAGFTAATVAIDADDGLWLGTFQGDRLVFIPDATP